MNEVFELKNIFSDYNFKYTTVMSRLKNKKNLINYITNLFNSDKKKYCSFLKTLILIVTDLKLKKCIICGKELTYDQSSKDNAKFCSNKCKLSKEGNPFTWESSKKKIKETNLKKFGVEYASQNNDIKKKVKNTVLERYGSDSLMENDEIKNKVHTTCLKKYGSISPFGSKEIIKKSRQTCLKKYNNEYAVQNDEIKEKMKKTCLEKYGKVTNLLLNEVKEKQKEGCLKKYNCEYPFQNDEIINKCKKIKFEKYGNENPVYVHEIKNRIEQTCLKKYGAKTPLESSFIHDKLNAEIFFKKSYESLSLYNNYVIPLFSMDEWIENKKIYGNDYEYSWKCVKCGNEFKQRYYTTSFIEDLKSCPRCFKCFPRLFGISRMEINFQNFIKEIYKDEIILNSRNIIKPYELDIMLPKINLAFEFNGIYFHSLEGNHILGYHLMKTEMCENIGIRLIHIWENEWKNNNNEIKNKIKNIILNNENIDYSIPLDRCWYQLKEVKGYKIKNVLPPEILKIDRYHIENCGKIIYEKI